MLSWLRQFRRAPFQRIRQMQLRFHNYSKNAKIWHPVQKKQNRKLQISKIKSFPPNRKWKQWIRFWPAFRQNWMKQQKIWIFWQSSWKKPKKLCRRQRKNEMRSLHYWAAVCVSCNRRAPAAIWKSFLMHRAFLICSFVCNM